MNLTKSIENYKTVPQNNKLDLIVIKVLKNV